MLSSTHPRFTVTVEYVGGPQAEPGLEAFAEALLLLGGGPQLEQALQVARDLSATLLRQQARRDTLERQAEQLRRRLGLIETQLKRSA
jgi:hypothetical protein